MSAKQHPHHYAVSLLQTMCALEESARRRGCGLYWHDVFTDEIDQLAPIPFAIGMRPK